jgi:hypothetical protein
MVAGSPRTGCQNPVPATIQHLSPPPPQPARGNRTPDSDVRLLTLIRALVHESRPRATVGAHFRFGAVQLQRPFGQILDTR